jgi:glycosyltransferase involved in cell wall biosynthesis
MTEPLVSVIMPVYNRSWCVGEAIESVLATGYPSLELLAVDDGSTDGTSEVLDSYAGRFPGIIKVLVHPGRLNRGIAVSRNLGVASSQGRYLAFLDSDDLFEPCRFHYVLDWLEKHPACLAGIEPFTVKNSNEDRSAEKLVTHLTTAVTTGEENMLGYMLFHNTFWSMPVITLRREALGFCGMFDERLRFAEETALWLKLAAVDRVGVVQSHTPVAIVRRHQQHSWDPQDRLADRRTFLHVLLNAFRWATRQRSVSPENLKLFAEKLRAYLVEIVAAPDFPMKFKLSAFSRSVVLQPSLALDRQVCANLARSLMRLQSM